jgi:putative transposase
MCRGVSQRRACALIGIARSALHYQSVLVVRDAPAVSAMRDLAAQYPRYGYRRIRIFLRRQGHAMSTDRCHRLWRKAKLQVPRRRPRRRIAERRDRPLPPAARNHVWAYDFVFDACANGQKLKCLTIVDEYTRECLAIDVSGSIRSARVIDVLSRLISLHGAPRYLRSDNGPEFVSKAILEWIIDAGIHTAHIDPGKPWQNGTDESFNGKLRDECLSMEWFRSREEAKVIIETWRRHYNAVRPHSSLDYQTPNEFKAVLKQSTHQEAVF